MNETLANKIRILAKEDLDPTEIAKRLGCERKYVLWVLWRDKNKASRREWEAGYRRDQYNSSPEVRARVLSALKKSRSKNRAARKGRP